MSIFSDYLENKMLDHVLTSTSYTAPANLYLALFYGAIIGDQTFNYSEISPSSGYARQLITFDTAVNSQIANNNTLTFGPATANWDNGEDNFNIPLIWAVMDSNIINSGNILFQGAIPIDSYRYVYTGDTYIIKPGDIVLSVD